MHPVILDVMVKQQTKLPMIVEFAVTFQGAGPTRGIAAYIERCSSSQGTDPEKKQIGCMDCKSSFRVIYH
jgi:hypothetical protein